jgi:hypothetical protein
MVAKVVPVSLSSSGAAGSLGGNRQLCLALVKTSSRVPVTLC